MAGDIVFNNATVQIDVAEVNVYGNPAEVSQRLAETTGSINSLREQTMATGQELKDVAQEVLTSIDELQAAGDAAEKRITDAIKAGATGAALQTDVDAAFDTMRQARDKARNAATDLNDGIDESDVPPPDTPPTP